MKKEAIFKKAFDWDTLSHNDLVKSKKNWQFSCVFLIVVVVIMSVSMASLFPLKEVQGVGVVVDSSTGHVEVKHLVTQNLETKALEAVKINLLTQYITWYKTYDESDSAERSDKIALFSTQQVFREYRSLFRREDKLNPNKYYKKGEKATVKITSVIRLNSETYQFRIRIDESLNFGSSDEPRYFTATVKFSISDGAMLQTQMWKNPIGLVVKSIRFDEEYSQLN